MECLCEGDNEPPCSLKAILGGRQEDAENRDKWRYIVNEAKNLLVLAEMGKDKESIEICTLCRREREKACRQQPRMHASASVICGFSGVIQPQVPPEAVLPGKICSAQHSIEKEHKILFDHTKVINKSSHYWDRTIKEAIEIKLEKNNFNRDSGLQLSQAWTPALDQLRPSYNQGHEDHGPRMATDSNRRNRLAARQTSRRNPGGAELTSDDNSRPGLADPPTNPVSPETA
ncbi:hypothetical protein ANN_23676 [Periplaneta americana]|uniref:Uncharacterized protein n=1 Tax=Periplaneta americana TaxID=6978 RepID=A0ABQ8SLQ6_PERAM|nr:hypothetical protein ANN_23676 [Periplaneta americana]